MNQQLTWIDPESFAYPFGSLYQSHRYGRVKDPDERIRTVRLALKDSALGIKAQAIQAGRFISGVVIRTLTPEGIAYRFIPKQRATHETQD